MFPWLRRWFTRPQPRTAIVYTRGDCQLCEVADETLRAAGYTTRLIDIDGDPVLRARFNHEVPVVEIDGRIRFRGRVDPVLLRRLRHDDDIPV